MEHLDDNQSGKKIKTNVKEILQNVTVIYSDNVKEHYEAVTVTDKGIIFGRLKEDEFIPFGFISNNSFKKINKGFEL